MNWCADSTPDQSVEWVGSCKMTSRPNTQGLAIHSFKNDAKYCLSLVYCGKISCAPSVFKYRSMYMLKSSCLSLLLLIIALRGKDEVTYIFPRFCSHNSPIKTCLPHGRRYEHSEYTFSLQNHLFRVQNRLCNPSDSR